MKSKHIITILLLVFVAFSIVFLINKETGNVKAEDSEMVSSSEEDNSEKTIVYYFHSTKRCVSCTFIENHTKETIVTRFEDEIKNGSIEMQSINVSDPENRHFIEKYELLTQSVVLVEKKGNQDVRKKKLEEIWDLVGDEVAFNDYIYNETKLFLEKG